MAYSVNQKGRSDLTVLEDITLNEAEKRTGIFVHFFFGSTSTSSSLAFSFMRHSFGICLSQYECEVSYTTINAI